MNVQRARQMIVAGWHLVAGNKSQRYNARYKLLSYIAQKCGLRMHNRSLRWFEDSEYKSLWNDFPVPQPAVAERKFHLLHIAHATKGIPGDTVECGVFDGASSYLIMKVHEGTGKLHHMFDSFEGLSDPQDFDAVSDSRHYEWKSRDLAVPMEVVNKNLQACPQKRLYKGWIPERFKEVSERRFALVHIDVDLYQPTYDSLAFFYERVSPGGMILCDDYGSEMCPGAFQAINEFMTDKPEHVIHLSTGQGVIIKQ